MPSLQTPPIAETRRGVPGVPHLSLTALAHRRRALRAIIGEQPALFVAGMPRPRNYAANAFAFRPHSHFLYLFGWGPPGAAALLEGDRATVFVPELTAEDALWSGASLSPRDWSELLGVGVEPLPELAARLHAAARAGAIATLPAPDLETRGQQAEWLARGVAPGALSPADISLADAIIALRLRHDESAQAELRTAARVTALAHAAGMRATRAGLTESVVRAAMEGALMAEGCGTAYGSIVTVHGEILHNEHHGNVLSDDDLLLADVGAETPSGWAGDVTRTWPVSGRFSSQQADIYDVVLRAQERTIADVAPGVRYRDLHLAATREIAAGLVQLGLLRGDADERAIDGSTALFFPHGVGHLLGLDVHDLEDLGDRAGYAPGRTRSSAPSLRYLRLDRDLQPGMAVTIEPGIYFVPAILDSDETRGQFAGRVDWATVERFRHLRGIRIEDDVLVHAAEPEVLTAVIPKARNLVETHVGGASSQKFGMPGRPDL
jgi:Xaa-Pro aminopeptidase